MKCRESIPSLMEMLESDIGDLVIVASEALSKVRDPIVIPALILLLDSLDPQISIAANQALDFFTDEDIMDPFIDALIGDKMVQYLIRRLDRLGNKEKAQESIKKLNLPVWMEMFLHELLVLERKRDD
jgi:HEAT repeat protein